MDSPAAQPSRSKGTAREALSGDRHLDRTIQRARERGDVDTLAIIAAAVKVAVSTDLDIMRAPDEVISAVLSRIDAHHPHLTDRVARNLSDYRAKAVHS